MAHRDHRTCCRCRCAVARKKLREVELRGRSGEVENDLVCADRTKCDRQAAIRADLRERLRAAEEARDAR